MPPIKVDGIEKLAQGIEPLSSPRTLHVGDKVREVLGVYSHPGIPQAVINAAYVQKSRDETVAPPITHIEGFVRGARVFAEKIGDDRLFRDRSVRATRKAAAEHIQEILSSASQD